MDRLKLGCLALLAGIFFLASAPLSAAPCSPSDTRLCLAAGRFSAEVRWTDFQGNTGAGHAVSLTSDTGYFWFFTATNVELVVKALDGRALNGHFWVFYGALSNVEYTMTVRDLQTGDVRIYENPSGQFASTGDTTAFPPDTLPSGASRLLASTRPLGRPPVDESALPPSVPNAAAACTPSTTSLCLGSGRFRVAATWKDFQGNTGVGQAVGLTTDTGYFWFFSSNNVEVVIKALDGRVLNDHFWIFYGALSNVEYNLTVTDTVTGIVRTYQNPPGLFASVGDVSAFGKPTTFQLIEGAVVKGEIDDETALLYKVYAFFGDERLPQAYRGDPPGQTEHGILFEVSNRWATLSAATRQLLAPFLTPPIYPESWITTGSPARKSPAEIRANWVRIDTARAAVWYRPADAGGETAAGYVAAEIENVWNKETGLMQRSPLSDAGLGHNGGDGKLDLYLLPTINAPQVPRNADGVTCPYPDQGGETPGGVYILLRIASVSTVATARDIVAHEFFHTIAARFRNGFNGWLNEGTATWMEDYVYPTQILNLEQLFAGRYLTAGYQTSFDQPIDGGYQDYLFFFYLARSISSAPAADVNRRIWENSENMPPLRAVDATIPGGFKERWPEFAMYCWNQPDVDEFVQWDSLRSSLVGGAADPYLAFSGGAKADLPARSVPHLAMAYAYVEVLDESVQRVEIQTQPTGVTDGTAKTQAWIKLADGSSRVEDWTNKNRVVFCRDKASESVTKLLILYTNSGLTSSIVWGPGKAIAETVHCGGFRGTVRESRNGTTADGTTASETMETTARFLPHPSLADTFYLAQISMRYSLTAFNSFTGCTLTVDPVTQSASFAEDDQINEIVFDKSTSPASYSGSGHWGFSASARGECHGETGPPVTTGAGGEWWKTPPGQFRINADGSLSGDYTESADGVTIKWVWSLRPD